MKSQNFCPRFLVLASLLSSLFLSGCLGGGIDPKDDPVQPSKGASPASAEDDVAENNAGLNNANNLGNGGENASENAGKLKNNSKASAENSGKDGEAVNNSADEDFLNANDGNSQANMFGNSPATGASNNSLTKNNGGLSDNNIGLNTDGDILANVDKGATDNSAQEPLPPSDSVLAPVAENSAPSKPSTTVTTGGVVRYVTSGGSKLYNKPNGDTLRSLEQGDHPLVNEEGEWSRTSDGYYTPAASLTPSPIPRAKQAKEWR